MNEQPVTKPVGLGNIPFEPCGVQHRQRQTPGGGSEGSVQYLFRFANGYGASVWDGPGARAAFQGWPFEVAVLRWDDDDPQLDAANGVADDPVAADEEELANLLTKIAALPPQER